METLENNEKTYELMKRLMGMLKLLFVGIIEEININRKDKKNRRSG